MKISLLNPKLEYIALGHGKIHARETGFSRYDATLDLSTITMCGFAIPPDTEPTHKRELDAALLCGRCYKALRTYSTASVQARKDEVVS